MRLSVCIRKAGAKPLDELRNLERHLVAGLAAWLEAQCKKPVPLLRQNQTAPLPAYPYAVFHLTGALVLAKGSFCEGEDGPYKTARQTYSFTAVSANHDEALGLAAAMHAFFAAGGDVYLAEGGLCVTSLGGLTSRDNFMSAEYEKRQGFDCTLSFVSRPCQSRAALNGPIETVAWRGGS